MILESTPYHTVLSKSIVNRHTLIYQTVCYSGTLTRFLAYSDRPSRILSNFTSEKGIRTSTDAFYISTIASWTV